MTCGRESDSLYSPAKNLLNWQTSDVFSTIYRQAFMMPDGYGAKFLWLIYSQFIGDVG